MSGYGVSSREPPWSEQPNVDVRELEKRFRRRVMVVAFSHLGDRVSAEDATQETLKRIVEALRSDRVRDAGALPSFVYQTVRHVCQQYWRKLEREGRALARLAAEPDAPPEETPLAALIDGERREAVREALARLKSADRKLLRLLYYEELEPAAAAQRLHLSAGALRVRKHRALRRLSALLGDSEPRDGNEDGRSAT